MRNAETILGIIREREEKPSWVKVMAARRRKTLVVCLECHQNIHRGQLYSKRRTGEP